MNKEKLISYLYDENNYKDENNEHMYEIENFALTLIVLIKNGEFNND